MRVDRVPEHLIVLGGGFIACELAHVFGAYGVRVTIVQRGPLLLKAEDHDISAAITGGLRASGSTSARSRTSSGSSAPATRSRCTCSTGRSVTGSRPPRRHRTHPEHGRRSMPLPAGCVSTPTAGSSSTSTSARRSPGVWALGDISSPYMLKHVANHEAKVVSHNIVNPDSLRTTNHTRGAARRLHASADRERRHDRGRGAPRRHRRDDLDAQVRRRRVRMGARGHDQLLQADRRPRDAAAGRGAHHRAARVEPDPAADPRTRPPVHGRRAGDRPVLHPPCARRGRRERTARIRSATERRCSTDEHAVRSSTRTRSRPASRSCASCAARARSSGTPTATSSSTGWRASGTARSATAVPRSPTRSRRRPAQLACLQLLRPVHERAGRSARRGARRRSRRCRTRACSSARSGSEAIDTAMKLARIAHVQDGQPQRKLIISRGPGLPRRRVRRHDARRASRRTGELRTVRRRRRAGAGRRHRGARDADGSSTATRSPPC